MYAFYECQWQEGWTSIQREKWCSYSLPWWIGNIKRLNCDWPEEANCSCHLKMFLLPVPSCLTSIWGSRVFSVTFYKMCFLAAHKKTEHACCAFKFLTITKWVFLMTLLLVVRLRAVLSPLSGSLSCLGLIALPLLSSEIHCGYEDIHHSCPSGFKVFQGGKRTSVVKSKNITGIFFFFLK